jgi:hypothetical protein
MCLSLNEGFDNNAYGQNYATGGGGGGFMNNSQSSPSGANKVSAISKSLIVLSHSLYRRQTLHIHLELSQSVK